MSEMNPQEIVHELDKHIVGQHPAKRAVAIALRNRWRRKQVEEPLRQEITPKNILMIVDGFYPADIRVRKEAESLAIYNNVFS